MENKIAQPNYETEFKWGGTPYHYKFWIPQEWQGEIEVPLLVSTGRRQFISEPEIWVTVKDPSGTDIYHFETTAEFEQWLNKWADTDTAEKIWKELTEQAIV